MKTKTIPRFVPVKAYFTRKQLARIRESWLEHWGFSADTEEEMSDEDILREAKNLSLINLPRGWKWKA